MAYLNILASVPQPQIDALRCDDTVRLSPSMRVGVSHLMAYWLQDVRPLGDFLALAIDGGGVVNDALWHPLRPPVFHLPPVAHDCYEQLASAWQVALLAKPELATGPRFEIEKVLRVYRHAAEAGECIISVLLPPGDRERADRVRIPFA